MLFMQQNFAGSLRTTLEIYSKKKKNCNHLNLAAMERRKQFWTGGFAVKVANLEVCGWCSSGKH